MPSTWVEVTAFSRLHFGLFSFGPYGEGDRWQYGGVGTMIDAPLLQMHVRNDGRWSSAGPQSERALRIARDAAERLNLAADIKCDVTVLTAPPTHVGLGSGTQLALAAIAALCRLANQDIPSPMVMAQLSKRARRSAIGLFGFYQGGLLVDAGKRREEEVSPLLARGELPEAWRFVLMRLPGEVGLFGAEEEAAFYALPPVDPRTAAALRSLAMTELLPAAAGARFAEFSDALFRFGRMSGDCYAQRQGGAYASPKLESLVATARGLGVRGVAQSSWGPTLCAVFSGQQEAESFIARLRGVPAIGDLETWIAAPANRGAEIRIHHR